MTNLFNLTGKGALVTGGNGGIGLGVARGLVGRTARTTDRSSGGLFEAA
jgi:2-deoxy-D-gluconate 3-dehydrogenase